MTNYCSPQAGKIYWASSKHTFSRWESGPIPTGVALSQLTFPLLHPWFPFLSEFLGSDWLFPMQNRRLHQHFPDRLHSGPVGEGDVCSCQSFLLSSVLPPPPTFFFFFFFEMVLILTAILDLVSLFYLHNKPSWVGLEPSQNPQSSNWGHRPGFRT